MGFFDDIKNFWKWMPNEVKIYSDKEKGIESCEVSNPPNPYTPQRVRYYEDKKRGIFILHTEKFKITKIPEEMSYEELPEQVKKIVYHK